jgi:HlyD family secretion protein/GAF domain-containing protein
VPSSRCLPVNSAIESDQGAAELSWREFINTDSPAVFARAWLQNFLGLVPDAESAVVLMLRRETGSLVSAAHWPEITPVDLALNAAVDAARHQEQAVVLPSVGEGDREKSQLCYPVLLAGQVVAMVAVKMPVTTEKTLDAIIRQLRWSSSWLELFYRRRLSTDQTPEKNELVLLLNVMASALEHQSFEGAAMSVVNELATAMVCARVSLGTNDKGHSRVVAVSGSAEFSGKVQLLQAVASAMDEALDQQSSIVFPNFEASSVLLNKAQQSLSTAEEGLSHAVCSVPLPGGDQFFGAITLERPSDNAFSESELEDLELIVAMLGPVLGDKRSAEKTWWKRAQDQLREQAVALFGPRHYARKSFAALAVLVIVFFSVFRSEYRVTADARLDSTVLQAIVAPVDGYIESAAVRAGDLIREGEQLYKLDDRDLVLEQLRWSSESLQLEREMRDAVAARMPAKVRVLEAQLAQASAQLALADEQLARVKAVAPFDGFVISGDLSQSLGAPVSRGEVLFEIAPLDDYRVNIFVDERDIESIAVGQRGAVVLRSGSESGMALEVERITPLAEPWDGKNVFRVEARLTATPDYLRPGMEGVGKIDVGQRRLIWIWTHKFSRWLRLTLWEWI